MEPPISECADEVDPNRVEFSDMKIILLPLCVNGIDDIRLVKVFPTVAASFPIVVILTL